MVTMRLDRSERPMMAAEGLTGYHCRLWVQVEGEDPRVIIEDLELGGNDIAYPVVYASRPACDLHENVRIRNVREAWRGSAKKRGFDDEAIQVLQERVASDQSARDE